MKPKRTYDTKCFGLAVAFLNDEPKVFDLKDADALATEIQSVIESFMSEVRSKRK